MAPDDLALRSPERAPATDARRLTSLGEIADHHSSSDLPPS